MKVSGIMMTSQSVKCNTRPVGCQSLCLFVCLKNFWAPRACIGTNLPFIFLRPDFVMDARGSSVGIKVRDGIYGPGIESC